MQVNNFPELMRARGWPSGTTASEWGAAMYDHNNLSLHFAEANTERFRTSTARLVPSDTTGM